MSQHISTAGSADLVQSLHSLLCILILPLLQINTLILSPHLISPSVSIHHAPSRGICQEEASICSLRGISCMQLCHSVPAVHELHGGGMPVVWPGEEVGQGAEMEALLDFIWMPESWCEFLSRFLYVCDRMREKLHLVVKGIGVCEGRRKMRRGNETGNKGTGNKRYTYKC